jgi:hypothetical protein
MRIIIEKCREYIIDLDGVASQKMGNKPVVQLKSSGEITNETTSNKTPY